MDKNKFNEITEAIKKIIAGTKFECRVYFVGGCVRDLTLNHKIKDIDITVSLPNGGIELANWLYEQNLLLFEPVTYPSYSTAMFTLREFPDIELEAVQTRKESYNDPSNRNPVTAHGTLKEDIFRRDFTTNSLCINVSTGDLLDLTGLGVHDILDGIIRTPLEPKETFYDDPLRILRAIRFAVRYNWTIEEQTFAGMLECADRLSIITRERVLTEVEKMLSTNPDYAYEMLVKSDSFKEVFLPQQLIDSLNELQKKSIKYVLSDNISDRVLDMNIKDTLTHIKNNTSPQNPHSLFIRSLTVIIDSITDNKDVAHAILVFMKAPNYITNTVIATLKTIYSFKQLSLEKNITTERLRKFLYKSSSMEAMYNAMCILDSPVFRSTILNNSVIYEILTRLKDIEKNDKEQYNISWFDYRLPINGNEIMELFDVKPGPEVGKVINLLLDCVFENPDFGKAELVNILQHIQ